MSTTFITDNIDRLQATALDDLRGWEITFRSANEGLHHQLYVNGELADWTDTIEQRTFLLGADNLPREIVIAAVDRESRTVDMGANLQSQAQQPPWVYRALVVRSPKHRKGSRLAVLGDHTSGAIDPSPLVMRELRPEWGSSWGLGEDRFGLGGFGHDAGGAPGAGNGAFGAGAFGIGAEAMLISAPLLEEGTHKVLLRVISKASEYSDGAIQNIVVWPPPPAPASLRATDYDAQTGTLTLQIE